MNLTGIAVPKLTRHVINLLNKCIYVIKYKYMLFLQIRVKDKFDLIATMCNNFMNGSFVMQRPAINEVVLYSHDVCYEWSSITNK